MRPPASPSTYLAPNIRAKVKAIACVSLVVMSSIDHATDDPGFVRASDLDDPLTRDDRVRYHGQRYDDGLLATVVAGPESKLTNVSEVLVKFDVYPNAVGVPVGALERIEAEEE